MSHGDRSEDKTALTLVCIGGFRGGAEGAAAPLFFLYFQNVLRFCFENRFIKCALIHLPKHCYFTLHHKYTHNAVCCMMWGWEGGEWGTWPRLSEFSESAPALFVSL